MKRFAPQRGSYFRKSLIIILLITCIPGLIIGSTVYFFAVRNIEHVLQTMNRNQVNQKAGELDAQLSNLELNMAHWAMDPRFGNKLKTFNFVYNFQTTRDYVKTFLVMQGSNPLIQNVSVFIKQKHPVLFNPQYEEINTKTDLAPYERYLRNEKQIYWVQSAPDTATGQKQLLLVHKLPGIGRSPFGIIVYTLDQAGLNRLLQNMSPYNDGSTFLMHNGQILAAAGKGGVSGLNGVLRKNVLAGRTRAGTFVLRWHHIPYSVTYGVMNRIGQDWIYVSASPMNAVTNPVVRVSKFILVISLSGLLLALILSWLASLHIYLPVARMVQLMTGGKTDEMGRAGMDEFLLLERRWQNITERSNELQRKLSDELPYIKEIFLLQFIQGYLQFYSTEDLARRMLEYGWPVKDVQYCFITFRLTGFYQAEGKFTNGDEELAGFSAANIVEELSRTLFEQFNVINFHDLSVGLLLFIRKDQIIGSRLHDLSERIQKVVNQLLKLRVTVCISSLTEQIKKIPALFGETTQAGSYRMFVDQNQIIDLSERKPTDDKRFVYPFDLEQEILQAVRTGSKEDARHLLQQFMEECSSADRTEIEVRQCVCQLFGSIHHIILQSGIHPNVLFHGVNMYKKLNRAGEREDVLNIFIGKVIHPFIDEMERRTNHQMARMVETVVHYVRHHYMEDISLEFCADRVETSTYTLSKAFKSFYGQNFIEYLTELRIEKAKELLLQTDLKILDISEQIGYQHTYLNRIFKKQVGMTPGRFRAMYRQT